MVESAWLPSVNTGLNIWNLFKMLKFLRTAWLVDMPIIKYFFIMWNNISSTDGHHYSQRLALICGEGILINF